MSIEEIEAIERAGLIQELGLNGSLGKSGEFKLAQFFCEVPMYYDLLPIDSPLRTLCDPYKTLDSVFKIKIEEQVKSIIKQRKDKAKRIKKAEARAKAYKTRQAKIIAREKEQEAFYEATLAKFPDYDSYDKNKDIEKYNYFKSFPLITEDDIILLANVYGLFGKEPMTPKEFKVLFGSDETARLKGAIYVLNNSPSSQNSNDIS